MSDLIVDRIGGEAEQPTEVEMEKPDLAKLIAENNKLRADLKIVSDHKEKLYKETKQAKEARDNASAEAKRIEEEKSRKDGEFEKLYQSKTQEIEAQKKEFEDYKKQTRQDKIQVSAMRLANELADGDNAELLSDFIARKLDGISDERGSLSDDVLADIKREFTDNTKYKSLLRGSKATGGNAIGNLGTKSEAKEVSRADFDKMDHLNRQRFLKSGGKIN